MSGRPLPQLSIALDSGLIAALRASGAASIATAQGALEVGLTGAGEALAVMHLACPVTGDGGRADTPLPQQQVEGPSAEPPAEPSAGGGLFGAIIGENAGDQLSTATEATVDGAELALWRAFLSSGETYGAKRYLSYYPDGLFAGMAPAIIDDRLSQRRAERNFTDPRNPMMARRIMVASFEKSMADQGQRYFIQRSNLTEDLIEGVSMYVIEDRTLRYEEHGIWLNYGEGRQTEPVLPPRVDQRRAAIYLVYPDGEGQGEMVEYIRFEWDPNQYMRFLDAGPANGYYEAAAFSYPERVSDPTPCHGYFD